jgi:hypothetical protein
MTTATPVDQLPLVTALPVEHLFDMHVNLQPGQPIPTPVGTRVTFITTGGVIEGPRLRGELLPGGGDWLLVGADGTGRVDVRATLPADGVQRLAAGQVLPFEETYIRTTPKFETSDERYAWLSEVVAVGYNILSPNHIDYRIYRVL